jgi:hypothetical protein
MIIGLPAILKHFSPLHTQMINAVVEDINARTHALSSTIPGLLNSIEVGSLAYPWTYVQEEEAPEDAATPLPCSFTDALHYMELTPEEAVAEYLSLFDTHVDKQFA